MPFLIPAAVGFGAGIMVSGASDDLADIAKIGGGAFALYLAAKYFKVI